MPGFTYTKTINAPITNVFALFTDIEKAPQRITDIKKIELLTPGPIGVGTKFKETRIVFRREASETFEFTVYEPTQRYELLVNSCGAECRTTFTFHTEGSTTRVAVVTAMKARSLYAKLFIPLCFLMMGMMKKCIAKDVDTLAKAAEASVSPLLS